MKPELLQELLDRIEALEQRSLPFPLDPLNRRIVNRDLPVIKAIDTAGDTFTVEVNDREYTWDFGAIGGGGGAKSVTLVVGPASNSDSADYDYTTDGTADEVQIQAAIDALPSTGGSVLLREGTYTLADGVVSSKDGVALLGVGRGTQIVGASSWTADSHLVTLSGNNVLVSSILFDGNEANIAGSGCRWLNVNGGEGGVVTSCWFYNADNDGILLPHNAVCTNCYFENFAGGGSGFLTLRGRVASCTFFPSTLGGGCIGGNDTAIVSDCYFSIPDSYILSVIENCVAVTNNYITTGTAFAGVCIDTCTTAVGNKIQMSSTEGGVAINNTDVAIGNHLVTFSSINAVSAPSTGILTGNVAEGNYIQGFSNAIDSANYIYNNNIVGFYMDAIRGVSSDRSIVTGNYIETTSVLASDNTYSGIVLVSNIDHCIITDNIIKGDSSGNDLRYCITEGTSNDYNIIEHNVCTGADTAQINVVGANTISANNITT